MERLRFDNETKDAVTELVLYHDALIDPKPRAVRRWLNKIGEHRLRQYLDVRMADILAHAEDAQASRIERCRALREVLDEVIAQKQCFTLRELAVNGNDVMRACGLPPGRQVGQVLGHLLDRVIAGELPNDRDTLLREAMGRSGQK